MTSGRGEQSGPGQSGGISRSSPRGSDLAVVAAVLAGTYFGSNRFVHFDAALSGYFLAVLIAIVAISAEVRSFWRRPPSAFYGRALLNGLLRFRQFPRAVWIAGRDLGAQRFIQRRNLARWLAHMLLSWGTLSAFALTVPLVLGWLHFEAVGDHSYRMFLWGIPTVAFATDRTLGWLVFHALSLSAVAVILGAGYFAIGRLRAVHPDGKQRTFHLAPLILLITVALTGLALPVASHLHRPWLFSFATWTHEAAVVVLIAALPYNKLLHLFIRPLHLGAQLMRAASRADARCVSCGDALAPAAQLEMVETVLAQRGFAFADYQRRCPACRRRQLSMVHAHLLGARFQPGTAPTIQRLREVA